MASDTLSPAQARRIALAAQGFGGPAPTSVGPRQLNGLIDRLRLLQLDSVNVFERSHYLPAFARFGPYDKALLDRLTFATRGRYTEYWAHEAAVIPLDALPLLRWRMEDFRRKAATDDSHWANGNGHMLQWLLAELAQKGPLPASAIEHDANKRTGPWWGWSDVKRGLEVLFRWGDVVAAGRTRFERTYALPEQVLPQEIREREVARPDAIRALVEQAARAHGIGTASDFADYYRLRAGDAMPAIRDLEDAGILLPVTVRGWERGGRPLPVWLHRDARRPRRMDATAVLSPFDPVVWERSRAERLFGFRYRIEIYTPAPKRVYGYYVLPVLVDDNLVGRVDLKSDRQNGTLRVQSAWAEPHAHGGEVAERLAPVLRSAAQWQGLDRIDVMHRGDLAEALAAELGVPVLLPR